MLAEAVDVAREEGGGPDRALALRLHRPKVRLHPRDGLRRFGHLLRTLLIAGSVPLELSLHDEELGLRVLDGLPVLHVQLLLRLQPARLALEHLINDCHARSTS